MLLGFLKNSKFGKMKKLCSLHPSSVLHARFVSRRPQILEEGLRVRIGVNQPSLIFMTSYSYFHCICVTQLRVRFATYGALAVKPKTHQSCNYTTF